jgi:hypothetical protein
MNWGLKITLLYVGFVAMILTLVFKASGEKVDLVTKDYYAQELVHQDKMEAIKRASEWKGQIQFETEVSKINVILPNALSGLENGKLNVYRPSDASLDKSFSLNEGTNTIEAKNWPTGYYMIQLSWTKEGLDYYLEETVFLP